MAAEETAARRAPRNRSSPSASIPAGTPAAEGGCGRREPRGRNGGLRRRGASPSCFAAAEPARPRGRGEKPETGQRPGEREDLAMLPKLDLTSWAQGILLPQPPA
ncbi:uncharacterized protein LOC131381784 [Hylobates moloch]|uniref:uncharacterized protein LOC131381784 n=1 Tax=Hylobates moloch TaxID=81572 RepID=UPI0026763AAB|nr:uncharacterized protein LOC131381784 [Hylobates moloch]